MIFSVDKYTYQLIKRTLLILVFHSFLFLSICVSQSGTISLSVKVILDPITGNIPHPNFSAQKIHDNVSWMNTVMSNFNSAFNFSLNEIEYVGGLGHEISEMMHNHGSAYMDLELYAETNPLEAQWREDMINIYVFEMGGSSTGACSFPNIHNDREILAIDISRFTTNASSMGPTMLHEIGHFFNLCHTHSTCGGVLLDDPAFVSIDELSQFNYNLNYADLSAAQADSVDATWYNIMSYHSGLDRFTTYQVDRWKESIRAHPSRAAVLRSQCNCDDFLALQTLYNNLGGESWTNNSGWEQVAGDIECGVGPCDLSTLYGITLDGDGRVSKIELANNNLDGELQMDLKYFVTDPDGNGQSLTRDTFKVQFELLQNLVELDLSNNNISNGLCYQELPIGLFELPELTYLNLSNNPLFTLLPSIIPASTKLRELRLRNASLFGDIPWSITDLDSLVVLNLANNTIGGNLPYDLANLNKLDTLRLNGNIFHGCIPSSYDAFCNISVRTFHDNPNLPALFNDFCNSNAGRCFQDCYGHYDSGIYFNFTPIVVSESIIYGDRSISMHGHQRVPSGNTLFLQSSGSISIDGWFESFEIENGAILTIQHGECREPPSLILPDCNN